MESEAFDRIQGRLAALDAIVTHIAFQWGMSQPQPPTALARLMQPLVAQAEELAASSHTPTAADEFLKTILGMSQTLTDALQEELLRRAEPTERGHDT